MKTIQFSQPNLFESYTSVCRRWDDALQSIIHPSSLLHYACRSFTLPLLVDAGCSPPAIVNNDSSDIVFMINSSFQAVARHAAFDLRPSSLAADIDLTDTVLSQLSDSIHRCGFAESQDAYDEARASVDHAMDVRAPSSASV